VAQSAAVLQRGRHSKKVPWTSPPTQVWSPQHAGSEPPQRLPFAPQAHHFASVQKPNDWPEKWRQQPDAHSDAVVHRCWHPRRSTA